jgi:type II secretory pathway pseudopilin PulG
MNQRRSGYTLKEVTGTIVVLAILLAISVFGVTLWERLARDQEQNEYAQIRYEAAQDHMISHYGTYFADDNISHQQNLII